ncbi:hypothetical protein Hte_011695 [Hypoxylon texense]
MRRLKALLRRRSFDEGSAGSTNTDSKRVAPLDTRRSLDSRNRDRNLEDTHRNNGMGRSGRAETTAEQNTDVPGRPKRSGQLHSKSVSSRPKEQSGSAESPLETISEARSQTKQHGSTETEAPSDPRSTEATTRGRPEGPSVRIVDTERNRPQDISVEEKEKTATLDPHDAEEVFVDCVETHSLHEAFPDLTNTVDTDETTTYAAAVTHEAVRPHVHEIIEEQIHRDIHNHEVYHRVQPVYDVEFLPARHFVPGPDGSLVEVSEGNLPDCTGPNQMWQLGKKSSLRGVPPPSEDPPVPPEPTPRQNVNSEPNSQEPIGPEDLQPTVTKDTDNTVSDFGDVYEDSWQASAARIF